MKNNKRKLLICFGMLVLGGASVMTTFRAQSQKNVQGQNQEQATVILEGQKTEKQKQHGKLFRHSGPKLRDRAARQTGDVEVEEGVGLVTVLPQAGAKIPVFQSAVCHADAVVIGVVNDKTSQLTEEENFIFTDYQVTVEEVLKNNAVAPLQVATAMTVTRDGGVINLNGRVFRAKREDFDPPLLGQRYLLFLRFIPTTGSYLAYGNGTFQLDAQKIIALGPAARDELAKSGLNTPLSFLSQIRTFADSDCSRN